MNNKKIKDLTRGSVVLIAIIVAAVLIIGAGVYMLVNKKSSPAQKTAEVDKTIEDIGVSIPELNFSASPLPDLNVSSLNVAAPQIPTNNIFSAPSINTDFSYKPNLDISVPVPSIDFQMPSGPANIPSAPTGLPTGKQTAPATGSGQPQVDCSAFSSVPACSYTGAPGSSAYETCKQCYPNK